MNAPTLDQLRALHERDARHIANVTGYAAYIVTFGNSGRSTVMGSRAFRAGPSTVIEYIVWPTGWPHGCDVPWNRVARATSRLRFDTMWTRYAEGYEA